MESMRGPLGGKARSDWAREAQVVTLTQIRVGSLLVFEEPSSARISDRARNSLALAGLHESSSVLPWPARPDLGSVLSLIPGYVLAMFVRALLLGRVARRDAP